MTALTTLRDARMAAGMSQQELATRCRMSISTISKLERGETDILKLTVGNLLIIAEVLQVDPMAIVGDRRKHI